MMILKRNHRLENQIKEIEISTEIKITMDPQMQIEAMNLKHRNKRRNKIKEMMMKKQMFQNRMFK